MIPPSASKRSKPVKVNWSAHIQTSAASQLRRATREMQDRVVNIGDVQTSVMLALVQLPARRELALVARGHG